MHLPCKCHLATSLPARSVPCEHCSWVEVNGKEGGSQPCSTVPRMTPVPLTKWAFWLTPTAGQDGHFMSWAIGRQMRPNHINWNLLSQDSSISISLWMLVCYTWLSGRCKNLISDCLYSQSTFFAYFHTAKQLQLKISLQHALIHIQFSLLQANLAQKKKIEIDRFEKSRFVPVFWSSDCPNVYLLIIYSLFHIKINIQKIWLPITKAFI